MTSMIAISATLIMCAQGGISSATLCSDGAKPRELTLNVMSGSTSDPQCDYRSQNCSYSWDSVLEIKDGDKVLFVLKPDGAVQAAEGFKMDIAASTFWRAMIMVAPKVFPAQEIIDLSKAIK